MRRFRLPDELATALCTRLGVVLPTTERDLGPLYRAWCATVPFDAVAKNAALAEGRTPPGGDPVEVAERFLATGLGGTCWGHVAVLAGLLGAAGLAPTIGLDRMWRTDGRIDFHSFVVVRDGARRWMLDPIHASGDPLPLRAGARGNQGVLETGIDEDDTRLTHWFRHPGYPDAPFRYALLSDVLDAGDVEAFAEVSGRFSGMRDGRLFLRRAPLGTLVVVERADDPDAPGRFSVRTWTGDHCRAAWTDDPDEAFAAVGCTPDARRLAERAGLL